LLQAIAETCPYFILVTGSLPGYLPHLSALKLTVEAEIKITY